MPSIVERSVRTLALAIATTRRPSHGGKNGAKPGIYYRTPSHTVRTVPYGVLFTARHRAGRPTSGRDAVSWAAGVQLKMWRRVRQLDTCIVVGSSR